MEKFRPALDTLIFEIRYASGHLYFDRCGQCLIDVERECPGWLGVTATPQTGVLECPSKDFRVGFSNQKFDFTSNRANKIKLTELASETAKIWKIIKANLGLDEFSRLGCRTQYLFPTKSIEEAEKMLRKSELNVTTPRTFANSGYEIEKRKIVVVLKRDNMEYRVQLESVTRARSIDPSQLVGVDPRALSEKQREFRIEQMKQFREYSADPMYAVMLDVDCVKYEPGEVGAEKYILEQSEIVERDFLPILVKL